MEAASRARAPLGRLLVAAAALAVVAADGADAVAGGARALGRMVERRRVDPWLLNKLLPPDVFQPDIQPPKYVPMEAAGFTYAVNGIVTRQPTSLSEYASRFRPPTDHAIGECGPQATDVACPGFLPQFKEEKQCEEFRCCWFNGVCTSKPSSARAIKEANSYRAKNPINPFAPRPGHAQRTQPVVAGPAPPPESAGALGGLPA